MFKLCEILPQETSDYNQHVSNHIILTVLNCQYHPELGSHETLFSLQTPKWTKLFQHLSLSKAMWYYLSPLTAQFEHQNQRKKDWKKIQGVLTSSVFASSTALGFKIFSVNTRLWMKKCRALRSHIICRAFPLSISLLSLIQPEMILQM